MIAGRLVDNPVFLRDLLAESIRENVKLQRLVDTQKVEIMLFKQRTEFDLSTSIPALCRRQAD